MCNVRHWRAGNTAAAKLSTVVELTVPCSRSAAARLYHKYTYLYTYKWQPGCAALGALWARRRKLRNRPASLRAMTHHSNRAGATLFIGHARRARTSSGRSASDWTT